MKLIFTSKSKVVLFCFIIFFLTHTVTAATITSAALPCTSYKTPFYDTVMFKENALLFSSAVKNLSVAEYQHLSGKKPTLKNKIRYLFIKQELKPKEKHNGTLPWVKGFVLGLVLGPIGVLIAYLFSKDKKLRHAAIAGGIISIVLFILLVILVASALASIPFGFIFPM